MGSTKYLPLLQFAVLNFFINLSHIVKDFVIGFAPHFSSQISWLLLLLIQLWKKKDWKKYF